MATRLRSKYERARSILLQAPGPQSEKMQRELELEFAAIGIPQEEGVAWTTFWCDECGLPAGTLTLVQSEGADSFGGALGNRLVASTFVAFIAVSVRTKRSRMSRRYLNKLMFSRSITATQSLSLLGVESATSPIAVSIGARKRGMTMGSSMTSWVGVRLVTGEYSWTESQTTETIGECTPVTALRNSSEPRGDPAESKAFLNLALERCDRWCTGGGGSPIAQIHANGLGDRSRSPASFVAFPTWGPMSLAGRCVGAGDWRTFGGYPCLVTGQALL